MKRFFESITWTALILAVAMGAVFLASLVSFPATPTDPATGLSLTPPGHAIVFPIPSDADEYLVPARGRFERWEHTPWDNKWYRLNARISIGIPVLFLVGIAGVFRALASWWTRREYKLRGTQIK